jgi:hypothetical protein
MRKNLNLELDMQKIFKEEIYDKLKITLIDNFLSNLKDERDGKLINTQIMKMFIEFMNKIDFSQNLESLYSTDLEQRIYAKTEEYYMALIDSAFLSKDYLSYMRWGIETVVKEENNLKNYLPQSTIAHVLVLLKNIIFFNIHREIMDKNNSFKFNLHSAKISVIYFLFSQSL